MFKFTSVYKYVAALCILLCTSNAFAQQNPHYSLLWKISGNGLNHPSYLFGTMHITDKRVFNFSDSVMLALQSCKRFAMEVHPDTATKSLLALMSGNDTLRNLNKLLSKKEYDELNKKFEKKNGYPIGNIDPIQLESTMTKNDKPDDKATFLDAYLYGIARTLNKGIYGLEDATSQVNEYFGSTEELRYKLLALLDDDATNANAEGKEDMTQVYSTGDLDAIYKYILDNNVIDSTIVKRNKVMAASMIKYMANEPLFTAVGAAHLPGPDGVIALLRKAGYTVTKVGANFTGVASSYKIDYTKMNWPEYRYANTGYAVSFPSEPIGRTISGLQNEVYIDISNNTFYGINSRAQDEPGDWNKTIKDAINNYLSTRADKTIIVSQKNSTYQNLPCADFFVKNHTIYMKIRVLLTNNLIYTIIAGSNKNNLDEPNFNRFFNSVSFIPIPKKDPSVWIDYKNDIGAFSLKLPVQPTEIIKNVVTKAKGEEHKFSLMLYESTDSANARTYLVRYNNFPAGMYLQDKEAVFDNLVKELKGKADFIDKPFKIWQNGLEGRAASIAYPGGYYMQMRVFTRGNRVYLLLKQTAKAKVNSWGKPDLFFDSFKILPTAEPDYYTYKNDSANFSVLLVGKPIIKPDTTTSYTSFLDHTVINYATNPNSGGLYDFEYAKISPYYRAESADSLRSKMIENVTKYDDSVLSKANVVVNGLKANDITLLNKQTKSERRVRIIQNGDYLYFLICYADSAELTGKTCSDVYNSFVALHAVTATSDLTTSKAGKIYTDLGSTDTVIYKKALGALSYYKFKPAELPCIYKSLQRNYPDDTTDDGARYKLLEKLCEVNSDSTASFLSALYNSAGITDYLKGQILSVIPKINKKTGYNTYMKLLVNYPPLKLKETYSAFYPLIDSIEFAAAHFNEILPFIKYDNMRKQILRVAKTIANQDSAAFTKIIKSNYSTITSYAIKDVDNYIRTKNDNNSDWALYMYYYFQLANKIKDRVYTVSLSDRYLKNDPYGLYAPDAIVARIYNHLPNNQLLLNKYLDSLGTRYNIMDAYNDENELAKVPLKYRQPAEYAKVCFYQYVINDDEDNSSPEKVILLGSILNKGSEYYVFKYLLTERDDTNYLIGITGPYKPGSNKLNFKKYYAYTNYDVVETNWRKQAMALIKPLIDSYK